MSQLPLLRFQAPRGGGPVLVLPGFMADDASTWLLRRFLSGLGYRVEPWGQGLNRGPMLRHLLPLRDLVSELASSEAGPVTLVGWSRGGVLARELARERPSLVRAVVTMGTPVRGGVGASSIGPLVTAQTGMTAAQIQRIVVGRRKTPIIVPIHAIYSKTDGVVAWQACLDRKSPEVTHYEVNGSHIGLGFNAEVYRLISRILARPDS
jgi:pimeloyl-ACP methyl ester carboxylesterase